MSIPVRLITTNKMDEPPAHSIEFDTVTGDATVIIKCIHKVTGLELKNILESSFAIAEVKLKIKRST